MAYYTSPLDEQLWDNWTKNKNSEAADKLVQKYIYLVNYHVQRIAAYLPSNVSKDDIKSLGLMGLYDAIQKFDAGRDLKFDTYASFRIKGVILDGLRKEDWLPRTARERAKKVERGYEELEKRLQRHPSATEVGDHLGIAPEEVEEAVKDTLFANVLSIEEKPKHHNDQVEGFGCTIPDIREETPELLLVREESYLELAAGIEKLNENEQLVISLFYKEELTLTEIGQILGLTTSRISQIHRRAISKLRELLS